jgi:SpoVK/Ycf46/Vps4 family AAA+-type ATPase
MAASKRRSPEDELRDLIIRKIANLGAIGRGIEFAPAIPADHFRGFGGEMYGTTRGDGGRGREAALERELADHKKALDEAAEAINMLQEQPTSVAYVLDVRRPDGSAGPTRATLAMPGRVLEVSVPRNLTLERGNFVRVMAQTAAIVDLAPGGPPIGGDLAEIRRVLRPGLVEVGHGVGARAVALHAKAEVGDRVLLDASATYATEVFKPAPNDSILSETTGVTWDDIGGLADAKRALRDAIEGPTRDAARFKHFGRKPTRGVLLSGPPGCGKTMLGKAAATALAELHGKKAAGGYIYVKGPEILNQFVGQSEANIRKIFDDARRFKKRTGTPAIVFVDEADAVLGRRGSGTRLSSGSVMSSTIVPMFLAEMDGLEDSGAFVLLATNRPDSLDAAVVRDGRVDRRIHVGRPTRDDGQAIVQRALTGKPHESDVLDTILDGVYSSRHVIAKVFRQPGDAYSDKLTLAGIVNGAMLVGLVERATASAMSRDAKSIEKIDAQRALAQAFNEALHVDFTDGLHDVIGDGPVARVERGKPIEVPS